MFKKTTLFSILFTLSLIQTTKQAEQAEVDRIMFRLLRQPRQWHRRLP